MGLLLCPSYLAMEHLPISPVLSVLEWRMVHAVALWAVLVLLIYQALVTLRGHRHQSTALVALVFIAVPFMPASHVCCRPVTCCPH